MKTIARFVMCFGVLLASMAFGQVAAAEPQWRPLRIVKKPSPVFPHAMTQIGVREGMARVAFSVDATGYMDDCLAIEYTHPAFAEATLATMKRWEFEPATVDGTPVGVATSVTVFFRTEGATVVSLNTSNYLQGLYYRLAPGSFSYRPRKLHELDAVPEAVVAPSPAYPNEVARMRRGQVTIEFYIDETGSVRLPCAEPGDDPELSALAVEALMQWKFYPPTVDGRPVLVRAMQIFDFAPQPKRRS
jgi:TonB family protein